MTKWDKLLNRICALSNDLRFHELRKVLESYGYQMHNPFRLMCHYNIQHTLDQSSLLINFTASLIYPHYACPCLIASLIFLLYASTPG